MSTKYYVDEPDIDINAYDTQSKTNVILVDQLQTQCGFTNYWLCKDLNGNLLICDADNLKDMYHW